MCVCVCDDTSHFTIGHGGELLNRLRFPLSDDDDDGGALGRCSVARCCGNAATVVVYPFVWLGARMVCGVGIGGEREGVE